MQLLGWGVISEHGCANLPLHVPLSGASLEAAALRGL